MPTKIPKWMEFKQQKTEPDDILSETRYTTVPINIFAIIKSLNIELFGLDNNTFTAIIITKSTEKKATIWINQSFSVASQRIVAAQALGHILLHDDGRFEIHAKRTKNNNKSIEAYTFGSKIIIPSYYLAYYARALKYEPKLLASHFAVPEIIMRERMQKLFVSLDW